MTLANCIRLYEHYKSVGNTVMEDAFKSRVIAKGGTVEEPVEEIL